MDGIQSYISLITGVAAAIASIGACIAVFWQARIMRVALIADHDRRKKQSTIEYMNVIRQQYRPINKKLTEQYGFGNVINLSSLNSETKSDIRELLSIVEHLSVGVNMDVYDIDALIRMSGSYLLRMRRNLSPYIENAQRNNSSAYEEFIHLCKRMDDKKNMKKINTSGNLKSL